MSPEFLTNEEIVLAARKNLSQEAWDYLVGGAESETTLRRNRLAFDKLGFLPRVLVDVSKIDPSTRFLGKDLRIPVMLAPMGSMQNLWPEGALNSTRAAAEFGTVHAVSSVTQPGFEVLGEVDSPKILQLYVQGDLDWCAAMIERVKAAGYFALCITVDMAVYGRRERSLRNAWAPRPEVGIDRRNYLSALTWDTMRRLKSMWGDGPFILKGIATAADARLAVDMGVDTVWVSNHGGRQLDHNRGTMDMLPEVVEAVAGRVPVVVDGGIQRGSDVVKALALGASAVAIGKLQGWGMSAAGQAGVTRVLELLEAEIVTTMALMGAPSLGDLCPEMVCAADPVSLPHEMSSWSNLPGGRLT